MKSITRLSLALNIFSLFSISYLLTSVSAQMGSPSRDTGAPGAAGMGYTGMNNH
jgi:hypothetical protein